MATWSHISREAIQRVHDGLPMNCPLATRTKAVDAAYPFGERRYFPYKAWLSERRRYLARYGYRKRGLNLTPLEALIGGL